MPLKSVNPNIEPEKNFFHRNNPDPDTLVMMGVDKVLGNELPHSLEIMKAERDTTSTKIWK